MAPKKVPNTLSLYPSLSLSIYLSNYLTIHLSICIMAVVTGCRNGTRIGARVVYLTSFPCHVPRGLHHYTDQRPHELVRVIGPRSRNYSYKLPKQKPRSPRVWIQPSLARMAHWLGRTALNVIWHRQQVRATGNLEGPVTVERRYGTTWSLGPNTILALFWILGITS